MEKEKTPLTEVELKKVNRAFERLEVHSKERDSMDPLAHSLMDMIEILAKRFPGVMD